jgi:methionyl-tRNA formyltransferase
MTSVASMATRWVRPRVLYLGLPLGALCLLADGLDVVGACISRPEQPGMRRLRRRLPAAPVLERPDLRDPAVLELLRALAPDQIVSWFWTKRVPESVLALAPFAFNVHPSLLPRHRGPDPYFWALASQDRETGVTAHVLTARYDEGPILAQRTLPIPGAVDAWRLARLLDRPALSLMREIACRHGRGETLSAEAQDEAKATLAPEPEDDDCELRFSWPAATLLARIRAAAPWPGAFTEYQDRTVVVLRAEAAPRPDGLEPGQAARVANAVVVAAADGAIRVLAARCEEEDEVCTGEALLALFPGLAAV